MDGVVGGTARGEQRDHGVDDAALVDQLTDRAIVAAERGDAQCALGGGARQRRTQRRAGIDERRARQLQAHRLEHHLVGIGRAVERARARCVVGTGLGLEQFIARRLAGRVALAHFGLEFVRNARRHRAGRHEHGRQVTEGERADQQAGHDLVADAEV
jgi:hypothetical protein